MVTKLTKTRVRKVSSAKSKAGSEDRTPAELKKSIYVLRVSLGKEVHRDIELYGRESLYNLAGYIVNAYGFDFDHAFGFFSNLKGNIYESGEIYELFVDEGNSDNPKAKGVEKEHVYAVFSPRKKMLFLFDYGDEWQFLVECKEIIEPAPRREYPRLAAKVGRAPKQY